MIRLKCKTQQYAWGKLGSSSTVALINKASDVNFQPVNDVPYAEFWMGTHPNGPATILNSQGEDEESLKNYLSQNPETIGVVPAGSLPGDLPFMFKVLSIRTALSIQAHPDKALARVLHETQPEHYKDPNHKPEMAVALTDFEALCGFRPLPEIQEHLIAYPELGAIVGTVTSDSQQDDGAVLKSIFSNFMRAPTELVDSELATLVTRLQTSSPAAGSLDALILRLNQDFPCDRGALCPLILNYINLKPGDAFFMGPNGPHAYISGDILECMALSDNTVRAGLSPKHKDVDTLLDMLKYTGEEAEKQFMVPQQLSAYSVLYRPPVEICSEFEVEKTELPADTEYTPEVRTCCFILIVMSGECIITVNGENDTTTCSQGHVFFVAAGTSFKVTALSEGAVYYKAHVNMENL